MSGVSRNNYLDIAIMYSQIQYRKMIHGDEKNVSNFISGVFHQFVAPGFSQQGIDEFMEYIKPDALDSQLEENHFAVVAEFGTKIIGIIEIRNHNHVALFFVDSKLQRKGIGKELLKKALEECNSNEIKPSQLTVNASPNSRTAYETMGFVLSDNEQCVNGIRFVPMALNFK